MNYFHRHPLPGIKNINTTLAGVAALLLSVFLFALYSLFDVHSFQEILGILSQPMLYLLIGLGILFLVPRFMRNAALCCLLLFMNGYFLFWLYVFLVIRYAGLPNW